MATILPLENEHDERETQNVNFANGQHLPKWAKYHKEMTSEFPSPCRGGRAPLADEVKKGPADFGGGSGFDFKYPSVKDVTVDEKMGLGNTH